MKNKNLNLKKLECGATLVEFSLMVSLILLICMPAIQSMSIWVSCSFKGVTHQLDGGTYGPKFKIICTGYEEEVVVPKEG